MTARGLRPPGAAPPSPPPVAAGSPPSALGSYNVRLFLGGQALSNVGTFSQLVAQSLLVLQLTDSGFALGLTMSLQALPMLLLAPWSGVILDRVPLRRLMLAASLVGALQAATLGVLTLAGIISLPWVLCLSFVLGCVQAFDRPAPQAFLVELVSHDAIPSVVPLASAAQGFGRLGGPALAAVLYAWLGPGAVFVVNALSYLAVVAALLLLRAEELVPRTPEPRRPGQFRQALGFAWRSPVLRPALLANALVGLLAFNFPTFYSTMATITFGQPNLFGLAETVNAVTAIGAGLLLARRLRAPSARTVGAACMALGSALAWVALSPTGAVFIAAMPYFGCVAVWYTASAQAWVQQHAPRAMAGRIVSLYTLGTFGTTPLGALIVGWVIDRVSPRAAVGLGAAGAFVAGLAILLLAGQPLRRPKVGTRSA
jgi:MFS family permease